ncbi:hypothetical protein MMC31_000314 [Peltigera leucophlebia]|nr:hypothetical protein [Peltigera leucophlebia]
MIFAGLIFSAAAVFLGLFINPPQGGGGIVNNLMVITFFLPSPPYSPPCPPPKAVFDVDADIFGTRKTYAHHDPMTCNITQDPMPQCHMKPRPAAWSSNLLPKNLKFAIPIFSLPSLSPLFLKIGNISWIFIALSTDSSLVTTAVSGDQGHEIELHIRLFCALQVTLSEHKDALAEADKVTMQAKKESDKAMERECKLEQRMERLEKERDDAFKNHATAREDFKRLGKEKEEEAERMKEETKRQIISWEKKEMDWTEKKREQERRHKEDKDGLKMGRGRERESWKRQVERLKAEKGEAKEKMEVEIKKILKEKERGREIWVKEKEGEARKQEQLEVEREAEMKSLELRRVMEKDTWEQKSHFAQKRIVSLEEENAKLRNAAMERERMEEEQKAAKIISEGEREGEKNHWEEQIAEAKKLASKLEENLLSGRKLIEDLQTDKRIDRQLLLELRAQLRRPTHDAPPRPPMDFSPLHFGETAYAMVQVAPHHPLASTPTTFPPQSPEVTLPSSSSTSPKIAQATFSSTTISSWDAGPPEVDSPIVRLPLANVEPRPIVRLPPPRRTSPSRLPTGRAPPPNTPIGPKGWRPNVPQRP